MDAERVEILHVADCDTVVVFVPDNLIFDFLPAFEGFLHKNLGREGKGFLASLFQLRLVVAEA